MNTPEGQEAMKMLDQITKDPKAMQKIQELSGRIMADITKKANGDPKKMQQLMKEAAKNPEAFASGWSAEDKRFLKKIAEGVEKKIKVNRMRAADGVTFKSCHVCHGTGQMKKVVNTMLGQMVSASTCHTCGGSGQLIDNSEARGVLSA